MHDLRQRIWELDEILTAAKWPPISPWWKAVIDTVYETNVREVVIQGGRRGGKSSTIAGRVAVAETLFGEHIVPPGDTGYFAIVSAERDQAKERLQTIRDVLEVLEIDYHYTQQMITLVGRNVAFRTFTASLQGIVSFTCIGALCDEEARWRDRDTGANPAREVLASLRPTMATQPNARIWHASSPWAKAGAHYEMVREGSNERQLVFVGSTWEMNPTITEAKTKLLEPDEQIRLREYGSVPMDQEESNFFSHVAIEQAAQPPDTDEDISDWPVFAGADFAFRRNSSALSLVYRNGSKYIATVPEERSPINGPLRVGDTVRDFALIAETSGANFICCDLHYIESVWEHLEDFDLSLVEFPSHDRDKAFIRLRVLLNHGRIDLSRVPKRVIDQLKGVRMKPSDSNLGIILPGGRSHADAVSALVCAIFAADLGNTGAVPRSGGPRRFSRKRSDDATLQWYASED